MDGRKERRKEGRFGEMEERMEERVTEDRKKTGIMRRRREMMIGDER